MREKFEKWARSQNLLLAWCSESQTYWSTPTRLMWEGWRAAEPAHPDRQGVALSDSEIDRIAREHNLDGSMLGCPRHEYWRSFARAILSRASSSRAEVEKNSERYKFLRRCRGMEHDSPFTVQHEWDGTLWGGDLDAAIDDYRAMLAAAEAPEDKP